MVFLFIILKNFVLKGRAKFVNMENVTVNDQVLGCRTFVAVTNWSNAVGIEVYNSTEDLRML